MKKLILGISIILIVISCGTSKTVRDSRKIIKGNWTLTSITYNEAGTYNATLFNDATDECFKGSTWQFVPNNNTGIYTLSGTDCLIGDRYFRYTIDEIDATTGLYSFLLKPTDEDYKSELNQGFRLKLSALNDSTMQWQQTVNVGGSPVTMNMNFTKI